jgi:Tol biopolymer transport system component
MPESDPLPDGTSSSPFVSGDGRFVVFESNANNLVPGSPFAINNIFVRDQLAGHTEILDLSSLNPFVVQTSAISLDGRIVVITPLILGATTQPFVLDLQTDLLKPALPMPPDSATEEAKISADGRFVVLCSGAANLVPGDTNGFDDIYLIDRLQQTTERITLGVGATEPDDCSFSPAISADGSCISFLSHATNLVPGDTNSFADAFVFDARTNTIERVSVGSDQQEADDASQAADLSTDGRLVVFESAATNLVADDTNASRDIFVRDRITDTTSRASVASSGVQSNDCSDGPSISANGNLVAFSSRATNLSELSGFGQFDLYCHDRNTGQTSLLSIRNATGNHDSSRAHACNNGRYIAFESRASDLVAGDTNSTWDVVVKDLQHHSIECVSVDSAGTEGDLESRYAAISADGRYVVFRSAATNLIAGDTNNKADIFLRDRELGITERISVDSNGAEGNGECGLRCSISDDGMLVVFSSFSQNLVAGDLNGIEDIFLHDRSSGTTLRVNSGVARESNAASSEPRISGDGSQVVFRSLANNLVAGDNNGVEDIFLYDVGMAAVERVSLAHNGSQSNGGSFAPDLSQDGRVVLFGSVADNLVQGDTNGAFDLFLRDRVAGTTERVNLSDSGGESLFGAGFCATLSRDGTRVAFESRSEGLVPGDTNGRQDVFVRDLTLGTTSRVSLDVSGGELQRDSRLPSISGDGRQVAFDNNWDEVHPNDANTSRFDVFLHGPALTLEAEPASPSPGETLALSIWGGGTGQPAAFFLAGVNQSPVNLFLTVAFNDLDGVSTLSATVPSGLNGLVLQFQAYGIAANIVEASNELEVGF